MLAPGEETVLLESTVSLFASRGLWNGRNAFAADAYAYTKHLKADYLKNLLGDATFCIAIGSNH